MRVTQQSMYNTMVYSMNKTQSAYMESVYQSATQKRINRPSDDPAGMAHVLTYRNDIAKSQQYEDNCDTAQGWLDMAGDMLDQADTAIFRLQELAEQAANDLNGDQRDIIAAELRQVMGQLLNLANTRYEGKSIFGGQNYGESAFEMGLGVTEANLQDIDVKPTTDIGMHFEATGTLEGEMSVRFPTQTPAMTPIVIPQDATTGADIKYEWSEDGGTTWNTGNIPKGESSFKAGSVTLTVPKDKTTNIEPYQDDTTPGTQLNLSVPEKIDFQVEGILDHTVMVRFPEGGTIPPANDLAYKWTEDGGATWQDGTIKAGESSFDVGAATVTVPDGGIVTVKGFDPDESAGDNNGTQLYVRPTAIYNGYDEKSAPTVDRYGSTIIPSNIETSITGFPEKDVLVKFPGTLQADGSRDPIDMSVPDEYEYSYSMDGGATWQTGTAEVKPKDGGDLGDTTMRVVIPGGFLDMDYDASIPTDRIIPAGAQLIVKPQQTDLEYEISQNEYMGVTNVGKNIFGGLYKTNGSDVLEPMYDGDDRNLFETVGRLIAYCESGNSDGIGRSITELQETLKHMVTEQARIGGKSTRLEVNVGMLDAQKFNQSARMSNIEDVNVSELLATLAKQKLAYQTILDSSSTIMQLSLANYL